jgi:hypothetical protein
METAGAYEMTVPMYLIWRNIQKKMILILITVTTSDLIFVIICNVVIFLSVKYNVIVMSTIEDPNIP